MGQRTTGGARTVQEPSWLNVDLHMSDGGSLLRRPTSKDLLFSCDSDIENGRQREFKLAIWRSVNGKVSAVERGKTSVALFAT